MKILAIETSCDETGIALVDALGTSSAPRFKVLANLISSQIKIHQPFGGVVPMLAKREHIKNLPALFEQLKNLKLDLIAVTVGPGLEPALWTGITFAKDLSKKLKTPLIGANHMEGHLYSFLLSKSGRAGQISFPAVALIVSGGHTILLLMESLTKWTKLGETRDDAAGEAFDKVARMLKLPYPGGPEIQKIALRGNPNAVGFPRPMLDQKNYDFSFSGLKTSVFYYLRDKRQATSNKIKANIAASVQEAIVDVLTKKTVRAAREYSARSIILCGGVAANSALRERLKIGSKKLKAEFFTPAMEYNTDNGAMIAAAGYFAFLKKKKLPLRANCDLTI